MASERPKPSSKKGTCFADLKKHLPGWLTGETYIHPTGNCEISNTNCGHYVVFHNPSGLDYDVTVVMRCESDRVRYLKGGNKQKRIEWSEEVRVPAGEEGYLCAPLGVVSEGVREIISIVEITISPLNGFGAYLPPYESKARISIRVDCKSPM
ncbi:hypothetical protein [Streptomyces coeruleorubidus]|uniref:hypothetical protein n=1 Tax=Streptomyces coeruleorubidus TaxID=116188 RepID=UPI0033ABF88C